MNQPPTPQQWLASLLPWQQELVRWGGATAGMTVSRERELTEGEWRGFTSEEEIINAVRPLWEEASAQATTYREGALAAGVPAEEATEENLMLRFFTTRVPEWMVERIDAAHARREAGA